MNSELSKNLQCVLLIGGVEIWIEAERATNLERMMETQKYIKLEGSTIAVSQIAGVFSPIHMDEFKRLKQGQWKCLRGGKWHDKFKKCECKNIVGTQRGMVEGIGEIEYPIYEK